MNDEHGDKEHIDALLDILDEQKLDALTVRVDETTYEVVRRDPLASTTPVSTTTAPAPEGATPVANPAVARDAAAAVTANYKKVTAPIVGVYYHASAPGAEPFVAVGDRVVAGQVVCILEAMKLMNEITTDYAGIVRRILPENGALVSLGEEMLWIEP